MRGRAGERLLLILVFAGLPLLFLTLVLQPIRRRMEVRKARLEVITLRIQALPTVRPLSAQEREVITAADAAWRTRIPSLGSDAQRFAHYHRVVTGLERAWREEHVSLTQVRSSWDGLKGSFSLPSALGDPSLGLPGEATTPAGQLQGWVLDASVAGTPDRLFQGLEALVRVDPLLEPVGLRWESFPDHTRQSLLLRNLILVP